MAALYSLARRSARKASSAAASAAAASPRSASTAAACPGVRAAHVPCMEGRLVTWRWTRGMDVCGGGGGRGRGKVRGEGEGGAMER